MADRISPARRAAFRALRIVAGGRADLGDALRQSRDPLSDIRDRALATDLVTGTLRWRGALDYQLQRVASKPLGRLDPEVLDALRLGAYQLLHLARIPVRAVVAESVELVKIAGFKSAAGFANAVLRRVAGNRESPAWPARPASIESAADREALVEHLSVVQSHPRWLVERWVARYGAQTAETWLAFNNRKPSLTLSPNRQRTTRAELAERLAAEGTTTEATPIAPFGLSVVSGHPLDGDAFREGLFLVQDEASQIVPELVQADAGHRVLDACASPGGKTMTLAAQCAPGGRVVATDVRPRRVALLHETLTRCRPVNVGVVHIAEDGPLPFPDGAFDRVLVDAPCSGLGTVRRDPDIRWRRQPEDLQRLAAAQLHLLARISRSVAPGGRVVYSTCSSEPEENDDVVARFLATATDFRRVRLDSVEGLTDRIRTLATVEGYLKTTPLDGLEGFFAAVLERRL